MNLAWASFLAIGAALTLLMPPALADAEPATSGKVTEEDLPPVLPPEQFFGNAAMGYAACKAVPHVCAKLFCYCGCDITDKHNRLLDCFTGTHGVDCHICQEEALVALRMFRQDKPLKEIQKAIDETYSNQYPFKEETPALKKYKATRLWNPIPYAEAGKSTEAKSDAKDAHSCCGDGKQSGKDAKTVKK